MIFYLVFALFNVFFLVEHRKLFLSLRVQYCTVSRTDGSFIALYHLTYIYIRRTDTGPAQYRTRTVPGTAVSVPGNCTCIIIYKTGAMGVTWRMATWVLGPISSPCPTYVL